MAVTHQVGGELDAGPSRRMPPPLRWGLGEHNVTLYAVGEPDTGQDKKVPARP